MFQWLRNLVGTPARPTSAERTYSLRARYDNAQTAHDNQRNWFMADYLSAKAANSPQVRRTLRMRSRYEVSNNPYLFGVCNSNADHLIDSGPTLQILTADKRFNKQVEAAWNEWAKEVALTEKLRTCKLAKTIDGEGFLILRTCEDLYNSVKLYPCDIEADQITTPTPANMQELWVDGVSLHPVTQRPTHFHVLKSHPGDLFFTDFNPMKVDKIAARFVIHWFKKFRPGQVRGVPAFTSALDLFTELRQFRKAVLGAAQIAAEFAVLLTSKGPAQQDDDDDDTEYAPFKRTPINRNMITMMPDGTEAKQLDPKQPATSYEAFQQSGLGEACRPLDFPLNLALGSSQKFNFSSSKLDISNYRNALRCERKNECEPIVCEPIASVWYDEAIRVPKLIPSGYERFSQIPHAWHWPGFESLDPSVDCQAEHERLAGGMDTWQDFWARRGLDWRDVMARQAEARDEIERLKLDFGDPVKRTVSVSETSDEGELTHA